MNLKKYLPQSFKASIKNALRIIDVILMIIALHTYPQITYKFSTRKALPSKKNKMKRYNLNEMPYKFLRDKSDDFEVHEEIDAIGVGNSFNFTNLKNITKPTYLLSFWNSLQIDEYKNLAYSTKENGKYFKFWDSNQIVGHNINIKNERSYVDYINPNITYVATNSELVKKLSDAGHNVLAVHTYRKNKNGEINSEDYIKDKDFEEIFSRKNVKKIAILDEIIKYPNEKPYLPWTQLGSFITFLVAVSFISKKINVYGWDFFLDKSPEKMSHFKLLSNMYSKNLDLKRSTTHFEEAMFNYYFGHQFSNYEKFNIYSYMGSLNKHKYFIKKIEKALFI